MRRCVVVFLLLFVSSASSAFGGVAGFMKARMGTLEGKFYTENKVPHGGGIVSFFDAKGGPPPIVGSVRRVPEMVARTDKDGLFSVKLLPGEYYMGALVRGVSDGPGPPREGEAYFFAMEEGGKLRVFEVKTKRTSNAGEVTGVTPDKITEFKDFVVIRGDVKDEQGNPVAGMMVTVKEELNAPRPKYISKRTDGDGRFELKLPPGRYFISARESLQAGRPRPGSYIGTYGKTAPEATANQEGSGGAGRGVSPGVGAQGVGGEAIAIEAKPGQTYDGITVNLYKIPDPEETRRKYEEEARIRKENDSKEKNK